MYTFAIASDTTLIVTDVNQCTPTRSVADLRTLHHTLLAQYLNEKPWVLCINYGVIVRSFATNYRAVYPTQQGLKSPREAKKNSVQISSMLRHLINHVLGHMLSVVK